MAYGYRASGLSQFGQGGNNALISGSLSSSFNSQNRVQSESTPQQLYNNKQPKTQNIVVRTGSASLTTQNQVKNTFTVTNGQALNKSIITGRNTAGSNKDTSAGKARQSSQKLMQQNGIQTINSGGQNGLTSMQRTWQVYKNGKPTQNAAQNILGSSLTTAKTSSKSTGRPAQKPMHNSLVMQTAGMSGLNIINTKTNNGPLVSALSNQSGSTLISSSINNINANKLPPLQSLRGQDGFSKFSSWAKNQPVLPGQVSKSISSDLNELDELLKNPNILSIGIKSNSSTSTQRKTTYLNNPSNNDEPVPPSMSSGAKITPLHEGKKTLPNSSQHPTRKPQVQEEKKPQSADGKLDDLNLNNDDFNQILTKYESLISDQIYTRPTPPAHPSFKTEPQSQILAQNQSTLNKEIIESNSDLQRDKAQNQNSQRRFNTDQIEEEILQDIEDQVEIQNIGKTTALADVDIIEDSITEEIFIEQQKTAFGAKERNRSDSDMINDSHYVNQPNQSKVLKNQGDNQSQRNEEQNQQQEGDVMSDKFTSSSKVIVSKYQKETDGDPFYADLVDLGIQEKGPQKSQGSPNNKSGSPGSASSSEGQDDEAFMLVKRMAPVGQPSVFKLNATEASEDLDDFIKKNFGEPIVDELDTEKVNSSPSKLQQLLKANSSPPRDSQQMRFGEYSDEDDSYSEDTEQSRDFDVLTPKQSLINGLIKLCNSNQYKQTLQEKELFIFDLDGILKILTYEEVIKFVLPALEIYAGEQEYLKIEFFRQLPELFKKVMKSPAKPSDQEALDLLTINVFPLISQMLMISEEQVQEEGVNSLFLICRDHIPDREEARFLASNVLQLLIKKIDQSESIKIAVLMLLQKFATESFFEEHECLDFVTHNLDFFKQEGVFKTKKQLLPCLLAVSKFIPYNLFKSKVFKCFTDFMKDEIWGVRKVCIEVMPELLKQLKDQESESLIICLDFLQTSMSDQSKWVRNQAFLKYGEIAYAVYLKRDELSNQKDKDLITSKLQDVSNAFYNPKILKLRLKKKSESQESSSEIVSDIEVEQKDETDKLTQSFTNNSSSNSEEDIDRIKEMWAYNLPCALLINGGKRYWDCKIRKIYKRLYKDLLYKVRQSLAASLFEVAKFILKDAAQKDFDFIVKVINSFLLDTDEITSKLLPHLCEIILHFPIEQRNILLQTMVKQILDNNDEPRHKTNQIKLLEDLFEKFPTTQLIKIGFHKYLEVSVKEEEIIGNRKRMAAVLGFKVIPELKSDKSSMEELNLWLNQMRKSKNFRDRQMYLVICESLWQASPELFKSEYSQDLCESFKDDKVTVVQIMLVKFLSKLPNGFTKHTDNLFEQFKNSSNDEIKQFCSEKVLQTRQFLNPDLFKVQLRDDNDDYKDEAEESDRYSIQKSEDTDNNLTEEEKKKKKTLDEEQKEISSFEKTVNIRFSNYSMLMRAQSFNSGISRQLLALLGGYGSILMGGIEKVQNIAKNKNETLDASEEYLVNESNSENEKDRQKFEKAQKDDSDDEYEW